MSKKKVYLLNFVGVWNYLYFRCKLKASVNTNDKRLIQLKLLSKLIICAPLFTKRYRKNRGNLSSLVSTP